MSFSGFALHERLGKALDKLGFSDPTPVQQAAIPAALSGVDLQVTARTGSGKTAAFVLPMLQRFLDQPRPQAGTRALILVPTRELARQTGEQLAALAGFTFVRGEVVTGGEDFKIQAARIRKNPDVLIGTPGRLCEQLDAGRLMLADVEILVLDEADRMLDMGFSENVLKLAAACSSESRKTWLFSATPGDRAVADIAGQILHEPQQLELDNVRNQEIRIRQQYIPADDPAHKERLVRWLLDNENFGKAIVFTNTRDRADRLGAVLATESRRVQVLHGQKDHKERKRIMSRLNNDELHLLVATDVAARGLDIDGLELVINFDMPRNGEDYIHRIGRTGRMGGNDGLAISLVIASEWNLMAGIQRYLKQQFEPRLIAEVPGHYRGPKKLKSSGKAAGGKKKKHKKKDGKPAAAAGKRTVKKKAERKPEKKPEGHGARARVVAPKDTRGGSATLKRKK